MDEVKRIALVAHDNRKQDLVEWVQYNYRSLIKHRLICTGTTGKLIDGTIRALLAEGEVLPHEISLLKSGPLGGDQQLGAMITEGEIDLIIFLWDPMEPHPHDVDVKALLRIAVLYNIPTACNRSTADFVISSSLFSARYDQLAKDYSGYSERALRLI